MVGFSYHVYSKKPGFHAVKYIGTMPRFVKSENLVFWNNSQGRHLKCAAFHFNFNHKSRIRMYIPASRSRLSNNIFIRPTFIQIFKLHLKPTNLKKLHKSFQVNVYYKLFEQQQYQIIFKLVWILNIDIEKNSQYIQLITII